jgi:DNA-binding transcriptional regulator YhcF (GntR family)
MKNFFHIDRIQADINPRLIASRSKVGEQYLISMANGREFYITNEENEALDQFVEEMSHKGLDKDKLVEKFKAFLEQTN